MDIQDAQFIRVITKKNFTTSPLVNDWVNTYEMKRTPAHAGGQTPLSVFNAIAAQLTAAEATLFPTTVTIKSVLISTWIPETGIEASAFITIPVNQVGQRGFIPTVTVPTLDYTKSAGPNVVGWVERVAAVGRRGRIFVRHSLYDFEVEADFGAARPSLVNNAQINDVSIDDYAEQMAQYVTGLQPYTNGASITEPFGFVMANYPATGFPADENDIRWRWVTSHSFRGLTYADAKRG